MGRNKINKIVCACNKLEDGTLILGLRHGDFFMINSAPTGTLITSEQGFVDSYGNFLTREEALRIAERNFQIGIKHSPKDKLLSEDIY